MDYTISASPLVQGLCVPLVAALDGNGRLDSASQEKLAAFVSQGEAGAVFTNGTSGEWRRLDAGTRRRVTETVHFTFAGGRGPRLWAGINDISAGGVLSNLEHALGLGAAAAVVAPLAVEDVRDVPALFLRHIGPLYERLGKGLPILLYDNPDAYRRGDQHRLRTREVKQLARLDYIFGVKVSADMRTAGNYLKGARNFKARHEFGVYLGKALQAFPFFAPVEGPLGNLKERLRKYWVAAEAPQGIVPLSGNLFPGAWRQAWAACVSSDGERMAAFQAALERLHQAFRMGGTHKGVACVKLALAEEGILKSPRMATGSETLDNAEKGRWLAEYRAVKDTLAALTRTNTSAKAAPAALAARPSVSAPHAAVIGFGAAVVDGITPVRELIRSDSKQKTLGPARRHAGGVIFNQLAWIRALGLGADLVGGSGSGEGAAYLRGEARRLGVGTGAWRPMSGVDADVARIFSAQGARGIYLEPGASSVQGPEQVRLVGSELARARFLITEISLLPLKSVAAALDLARVQGKESFLDVDVEPRQALGPQELGTAAEFKRCLALATHIKASLEAARQLAPKAPDASLARAIHKKFSKGRGNWVTVTAGARGAWGFDGVKAVKRPAFKVRVVDGTGCGDAFHAALVCGRAAGMDLKAALDLACAAGGVAGARSGAVPGEASASQVLKLWGGTLPWRVDPVGGGARSEAAEHLRVALAELGDLAANYPEERLEAACSMILEAEAKGRRVHVTGVGKCEYVAGFVASSYSSTGTPAFFLHATEAGHGASGQVAAGDVVIAISNSGETGELKAAVTTLSRNGALILGVGGKPTSWLARHSAAFLWAGVRREGDELNLAPRNSVLAEIMVLNALGVALQHRKRFTAAQFRSFHPGGSLGRTDED